jgi:hypothetical protein
MNTRKYPKTMHLPWSPGTQSDDRLLKDVKAFEGMEIVVTEKLDGENTTLYSNHMHARSMDSRHHDSRNWVKALHGGIKYNIPENYRICGENVYAEHSIRYEALTSFFYVFGIYMTTTDSDICISWDDTVSFCKELGIEHVPVLYRGIFDQEKISACMTGVSLFGGAQEGYVVRNVESFEYSKFQQNVTKYVRKGHVQTTEQWSTNWKPNKMVG